MSSPCSADTADYVFLFLTCLLLSASWWFLDLFALMNHGLLVVVKRMGWHILRLHSPSSVALVALARSRNPASWPSLYYYGFDSEIEDESPEPISLWGYARVLIPDGLMLITACYHVARLTTMPAHSNTGEQLALSSWMVPQLPAVIIGFWVLAASQMRIRHRGVVILLGVLALLIIGGAFIFAVRFEPRPKDDDPSSYELVLTAVSYVALMIPWASIHILCGIPMFVLLIVCGLIRVLGVSMDLVTSPHSFPFCAIDSEKLSKFVMAFAVVGFLIAGFAAYATFPALPKVWAMIFRKGTRDRPDYVELNDPASVNNQHTVCAPFPPVKKAEMSNPSKPAG
jgi:hypothetical protein